MTEHSRALGDLGDLRPFRDLAEKLAGWDAVEREKTGGTDALVARIRAMLDKALADAQNPHLEEGMKTADFARLCGITPSAVYKREKRGTKRVPAIKRTSNGRILTVSDDRMAS